MDMDLSSGWYVTEHLFQSLSYGKLFEQKI